MSRRLTNSQTPISGFRFKDHLVRTYYDHAETRWVYEEWQGERIVDRRYFPKHPSNAENLFARVCNRILTNHNIRKPPYLPRHHLPPGPIPPGVRVYDPAKARQHTLFEYYRMNTLKDE